MKRFFLWVIMSEVILFTVCESCTKRDTPFACQYFASCQWIKDNKCVLLPRGFNYDDDDYVLYKSFKPLTYYSAQQENGHENNDKKD